MKWSKQFDDVANSKKKKKRKDTTTNYSATNYSAAICSAIN
jgi:hypothetical protein